MRGTEYLRVGIVTKPHGIKGEVSVYPTTDDPDRFSGLETLLSEKNGVRREHRVESVKYFKGTVILKLSGSENMDDAEKLRSADLLIHRSQSSPCREGEYFVADLLEMEVFRENGEKLGTVKDVMTGGANPVIVVEKTDGKELLLPKIPSCILNVDVPNQKMIVYVLPGLED